MTLQPGQRVRLFLWSRMDEVEGTVISARYDGEVLVKWDDEPFVQRIIETERLTVIHNDERT